MVPKPQDCYSVWFHGQWFFVLVWRFGGVEMGLQACSPVCTVHVVTCLVQVWNLTNCKLRSNLVGHTGYINTVTVSPDGSLCASGGKVGPLHPLLPPALPAHPSSIHPQAVLLHHVCCSWVCLQLIACPAPRPTPFAVHMPCLRRHKASVSPFLQVCLSPKLAEPDHRVHVSFTQMQLVSWRRYL